MNHYWGSNETQSKCLSVTSLYTLQNHTKCRFCIKNMSTILQRPIVSLARAHVGIAQYFDIRFVIADSSE